MSGCIHTIIALPAATTSPNASWPVRAKWFTPPMVVWHGVSGRPLFLTLSQPPRPGTYEADVIRIEMLKPDGLTVWKPDDECSGPDHVRPSSPTGYLPTLASKSLTMILSLAPTPPANAFVPKSGGNRSDLFPAGRIPVRRLHHVQLVDVVDPAHLFENYVYVSGTSPAFVKHFEDYATTMANRFSPAAKSLVVDIGSTTEHC